MRIRIKRSFAVKLNNQVKYIAKDKPAAARKFKNDLKLQLLEIPTMPYSYRNSIFFDREDIRDLVFKGYVITFVIKNNIIEVFGFIKYQNIDL